MPDPKPDPILLLTRPEPAARRFAQQLGLQIETLLAPLMRIELLDIAPPAEGLRGIILTSENGALAAGRMTGLPRQAWCVGARTAQVARAQGFDAVSADGDAQDLIAMILSHPASGPLLHLHGEHVRGDIVGRLNTAGVVARSITAYRQRSQSLTPATIAALAGTRPVILPLFSPRTVSILLEAGPFAAPLHVVPISQAVADLCGVLRPKTVVRADSPDAEAMVRAVRISFGLVNGG